MLIRPARPGRVAERPREGEAPWTAAKDRGRRKDRAAARTGRLVAQDRAADGLFGQDVPKGGPKVHF
jgi:hypothetical protein